MNYGKIFYYYKMDLLENGLDFIDKSLKPILDSKNQHDLKYSILHLSAGIELVLKEILKNEHWSFIFEDINKASLNKLNSGDFVSVAFETIITRVTNIAQVDIAESSLKQIRAIKKMRNKMEHFSFAENPYALRSTVSKVLCDILGIIKNNLDINNYSKDTIAVYDSIIHKTLKFEEYVKIKMAKLEKEINKLKEDKIEVVECPKCHQVSFPLDEDLKCLFCEYHDTPEQVAEDYLEEVLGISIFATIKDGGDNPICECPECESETMIILDDGSSLCFSCFERINSENLSCCNDCGNIIVVNKKNDYDDIYLCPTCRDNRMPE
jgi:hypothetical protein